MDIDTDNEPTYPMKNYTGNNHKRSDYERLPQQKVDVEVLKSNKRHEYSAVFENTVPPSGLSGIIRQYAFKHSEDRYTHWIPLILADRVNAWEGIIEDLAKGIIPNVFAEREIKSELEYNPKALAKKILITASLTTIVITL